jgi:hypothetical protein
MTIVTDRDRSEALRAAMLRVRAAQHRHQAAMLSMAAAAVEATSKMRRLAESWIRGERQEFETHSDVQEAVAQMRGFYEE